jgi:hypothetical protein
MHDSLMHTSTHHHLDFLLWWTAIAVVLYLVILALLRRARWLVIAAPVVCIYGCMPLIVWVGNDDLNNMGWVVLIALPFAAAGVFPLWLVSRRPRVNQRVAGKPRNGARR